MEKALDKQVIKSTLQHSIIGEVYPNIRMIVYKYDQYENNIFLYYYLDREPEDDDTDSISIVMGLFLSNFSGFEFNEIHEICLFSDKLLSELDVFDGIIFARKE